MDLYFLSRSLLIRLDEQNNPCINHSYNLQPKEESTVDSPIFGYQLEFSFFTQDITNYAINNPDMISDTFALPTPNLGVTDTSIEGVIKVKIN